MDFREIENLMVRYAELVDDGDFAGLGELLAEATFRGSGEPLVGGAAIEQWFRDTVILYQDRTPRTHHIVTNIAIESHEDDAATARSSVTVLQALLGQPPQVIATGHYQDRFVRRDGVWRFAERVMRIRLPGDLTQHLRD